MARGRIHWVLMTGVWTFAGSLLLTHFLRLQGDDGDFYHGLLLGVPIGLMIAGLMVQSYRPAK